MDKMQIYLILELVLVSVAFGSAPYHVAGWPAWLPYVVAAFMLAMAYFGLRYSFNGKRSFRLYAAIFLAGAVLTAAALYVLAGGGILFPLGLLACGALYLYVVDIPVRQLRQREKHGGKK